MEWTITQEKIVADKAVRLRSMTGIGPVSAAMIIAVMPELGKMTSSDAAAMSGLAPLPYDGRTLRGKRMIAGGRRALRYVLDQGASATTYRNPVSKSVAQRLKKRGKPHKLIIASTARRLVTSLHNPQKRGHMESSKPNFDIVAGQTGARFVSSMSVCVVSNGI